MINSLVLQNFQSHKKTKLNFDPGVNIIIGNSDSGKTAIIRALRLAMTNRPVGDSYRSTWGGKTRVSIITEENNKISRIKDKGKNIYQLNDNEFAAIRTDVPEEIQLALNTNEINLQSQFDQPFLLTATSGEVAAHFNRIAHIDQIDVGIKQVQSWIKQIGGDIKAKENQLKEFNTELIQFDYLEKFEIDLEVLEEVEKDLDITIKSKAKLNSIIETVEETEQTIREKSVICLAELTVIGILGDITKKELLIVKETKLNGLITTIEETQGKLNDLEGNEDLLEVIIPIIKDFDSIEALEKEKASLNGLISLIEETSLNIKTQEKKEGELSIKFKKEFPETCPLCETKTDGHFGDERPYK